MVTKRVCRGLKADGSSCGMPPLRQSEFCLAHDPDHSEEAQEARRLGGQRRRRETIVSAVYDFEGLGSIPQVRRLLEVAAVDTLGLENSVARNRTLASLAQAAVGLLEKGEFEERLDALEEVLQPRKKSDGRRR